MSTELIKILIVDDHQLIINGLKSLLANVNNFVIIAEANNGEEALNILSKISVDVVLMDIEMPVMNGWESTKRITSLYKDVKVIALSTFSEKTIINKMLEAGASGYILKNIKKEMLIEAIETIYNGNTYFSSEISFALIKPSVDEVIKPKKQTPDVNILSKRETEILQLIAEGLSNNEIAEKLFLSPKTIKVHRENIMNKLNIHNIVGLVRYAIDNKLVD